MHILIVEDSKTLQKIMEKQIVDAGHKASLAQNGEMAVQMVDKTIDLVIMDVEMPGLDGYETTRLIRENLADDWIPIIFVTGMADDKDLAAGIEAGGDDYLIKPVSPVILRAKIRAMERIADMRRQLNQLNDELTELSQHDSLTGLFNRRVFEEKAESAWQRTTRFREPLTLLLLDIDFFKPYNDYYGHVEGDECIRKVAQALQKALNRPGDLVARYGGEEFICLLPNTDAQGAKHIGEQLRKMVRDLCLEHRSSQIDKYVTISIGANVVRYTTGINLSEQITLADKALYESKRSGRNKVTVTEFENLSTVLLIDNHDSNAAKACEYLSGHCKLVHLPSLAEAHKREFATPELIVLNSDCSNLLNQYKNFSDEYHLSLTPVLVVTQAPQLWRADDHPEVNTVEVLTLPLEKHKLVSRVDALLGIEEGDEDY
jgi:diguanylate cyclase (GGDEF)-like protein